METPSGMTSVVSTVAGGLETPDFLDLRKNAGVRTLPDTSDTGPKQLYQVVPERQTAIRGLMGSERGYDVSSLSHNNVGANVPVLGQEQRGNKVSRITYPSLALLTFLSYISCKSGKVVRFLSMPPNWKACQRIRCDENTKRGHARPLEIVYMSQEAKRTFRTWS
jgi:hypothetical protein